MSESCPLYYTLFYTKNQPLQPPFRQKPLINVNFLSPLLPLPFGAPPAKNPRPSHLVIPPGVPPPLAPFFPLFITLLCKERAAMRRPPRLPFSSFTALLYKEKQPTYAPPPWLPCAKGAGMRSMTEGLSALFPICHTKTDLLIPSVSLCSTPPLTIRGGMGGRQPPPRHMALLCKERQRKPHPNHGSLMQRASAQAALLIMAPLYWGCLRQLSPTPWLPCATGAVSASRTPTMAPLCKGSCQRS